jgi:hypothetical protein
MQRQPRRPRRAPGLDLEHLGSSISITMDTYSNIMPRMSRGAADAIDTVLGE